MLVGALAFFCASAQWPGMGPESKVVLDSIYSETLGAWRHYNVFVPKTFYTDPDAKFPVLYLLHGMNDTHMGWPTRGHVKDVMDQLTASGDAAEMIIVTPNAGGQAGVEWNGYFNMPGWNYEDFFFNELMPTVEAKYRAEGTRGKRAIAGLSMGGGGCVSYAQRHPELFCAAYAMSALMDTPDFGQPAPAADATDKVSLLTKAVNSLSCIKYVQNADEPAKQNLRSLAWFVDCGDDDFLLPRNIEFTQAMRMAGIPCEFRVRDGGHTWEYWHSALYTALPFVSRNFK